MLPGAKQGGAEWKRRKQRKQRKTWPAYSASSVTSCSRFFEVTDGISRLDPARSEPASGGVEQEETEEAEENVARLLCFLCYLLFKLRRQIDVSNPIAPDSVEDGQSCPSP